jgi:branched-chain amino acid transport system ATP-binding protein
MQAARQSPQSSTAAPTSKTDNRQAPVLLSVEGLKKRFGGQVVLDGVDLELRQGEVVLLRGENGSGKTTLLNILTGNLEPDAGTIHYLADESPRAYRFPRRWWQELNPFDHFTPEFVAREGVCRTWQDIRLFNGQTLRDNIVVAEPDHAGEKPLFALFAPGHVERIEEEMHQRADAMLVGLGLAGRESSSADKISLGQSKRVAIARAVAAGARVLFLDEPLAGLDHAGVTQVLKLLERLVREQAVTLIIIEHTFNHIHLRGLVTTDWLLENGKLIPNGNAAQQTAIRSPQSGIPHIYPWMEFFVDESSTVIEESLPNGARLTRIRRSDRVAQNQQAVLEIRNLVLRRGSRVVIGLDDEQQETGFNLQVIDGEITVLQAPNGWGKSSLLASISGLLPVFQGDILLGNQPINRLPVWDRVRKGLHFIPSDHNVFPDLTAQEALRLARQPGAIAEFGILARRRSSELSGGQKQRLALLAEPNWSTPKLRMFDEPFANLDISAIRAATQQILSQTTNAVLIAFPSTTQ